MYFQNKFRVKELLIYQNEYWVWSLRPNQLTLASSIISLKRTCESFGDLDKDEAASYGETIKIVNETITKTFRPVKLNYMTLMLIDDQVHTHVIPRYETPITFKALEFKDHYWPGIVDMGGKYCTHSDSSTLTDIMSTLKKCLKKSS